MFRRRDQRMDASQEDPQEPGHVEVIRGEIAAERSSDNRSAAKWVGSITEA